jgi:hypothetical protein
MLPPVTFMEDRMPPLAARFAETDRAERFALVAGLDGNARSPTLLR